MSKLKVSDTAAAVDAFMAALEHPHKDAIAALRHAICGADPSITEGVKWNAPSFRTTEYFATTHLRAKTGIAVILHLGAKVRDTEGIAIDDQHGLLEWLGKDRAIIQFSDLQQLRQRATALQDIVRKWLVHV